jgi:hypothetical protein avisC_01396
MPTASELASPKDFLTMRRMAQDFDSEIDADLVSLLDGTLGYAEGARQADENSPEGPGDRIPGPVDEASRGSRGSKDSDGADDIDEPDGSENA